MVDAGFSAQSCGCDVGANHYCQRHAHRRGMVVYIAGPFRAKSDWGRHKNIEKAQALAFQVWEEGFVALCPHNNTRHFDGSLPDHVWLNGDLRLLSKCDAILMVEGWETSTGARAEMLYAEAHGIQVFETLAELLTEY